MLVALLLVVAGVAGCTSSSGANGSGSSGPGSGTAAEPSSSATTTPHALPGCPATLVQIEALLGEPIVRVEGAVGGSTAQVCAFGTSTTDLGALSVAYLRFPRADLAAKNLAQAYRRYGAPLAGHTIVRMPSWGAGAFLDESQLAEQNVTAEFAWIAGYEVILGMHSDDPHVGSRRSLIDRLVSFARP